MTVTIKFAVTTGRDAGVKYAAQAKAWANSLGVPYFERAGAGTVDKILAEKDLDCFIAACVRGPVLFSSSGKFFYHPGMSVLRLQKLQKGLPDNFIEAAGLCAGMRVFDGTLGLGSDAIIASYVVGVSGKVVGTEASLPLFFTVAHGLQNYIAENGELTAAMRRITLQHGLAGEYLKKLPSNSFDVVYFDPMFQKPVEGAAAMDAMRPYVFAASLREETVAEALRVAPKIVIKESSVEMLRRYGCDEISGGRYSRVKYGIIRR